MNGLLKLQSFFFIKFLFFQHNDLEETIKRIQNHKGVVGMMIVNQDGKHFISHGTIQVLRLQRGGWGQKMASFADSQYYLC